MSLSSITPDNLSFFAIVVPGNLPSTSDLVLRCLPVPLLAIPSKVDCVMTACMQETSWVLCSWAMRRQQQRYWLGTAMVGWVTAVAGGWDPSGYGTCSVCTAMTSCRSRSKRKPTSLQVTTPPPPPPALPHPHVSSCSQCIALQSCSTIHTADSQEQHHAVVTAIIIAIAIASVTVMQCAGPSAACSYPCPSPTPFTPLPLLSLAANFLWGCADMSP